MTQYICRPSHFARIYSACLTEDKKINRRKILTRFFFVEILRNRSRCEKWVSLKSQLSFYLSTNFIDVPIKLLNGFFINYFDFFLIIKITGGKSNKILRFYWLVIFTLHKCIAMKCGISHKKIIIATYESEVLHQRELTSHTRWIYTIIFQNK